MRFISAVLATLLAIVTIVGVTLGTIAGLNAKPQLQPGDVSRVMREIEEPRTSLVVAVYEDQMTFEEALPEFTRLTLQLPEPTLAASREALSCVDNYELARKALRWQLRTEAYVRSDATGLERWSEPKPGSQE